MSSAERIARRHDADRVVRALARAAVLALGVQACGEPCGPPVEPLIAVMVTVAVPTGPRDYVHVSMLNGRGDVLSPMSMPMISVDAGTWHTSVGTCDGIPQESGTFTVLAWVDDNPYGLEPRPPQDAPQAMDLIDVHCTTADGCFAARAARVRIE